MPLAHRTTRTRRRTNNAARADAESAKHQLAYRYRMWSSTSPTATITATPKHHQRNNWPDSRHCASLAVRRPRANCPTASIFPSAVYALCAVPKAEVSRCPDTFGKWCTGLLARGFLGRRCGLCRCLRPRLIRNPILPCPCVLLQVSSVLSVRLLREVPQLGASCWRASRDAKLAA